MTQLYTTHKNLLPVPEGEDDHERRADNTDREAHDDRHVSEGYPVREPYPGTDRERPVHDEAHVFRALPLEYLPRPREVPEAVMKQSLKKK